MQDEVAKHTKKIYSTVKESTFSFGEKIKEILIEIFIIVFAVMLSISLHDWSEHRHQQKEVKEFLVDLKDDLNKDIESMNKLKKRYERAVKEYSYLESLNAKRIDSIKAKNGDINMSLILNPIEINDGNYESFKSSGKIGFIENKKIKILILRYYEKLMPYLKTTGAYYESSVIELGNLVKGHRDENIFLDSRVKAVLRSIIEDAQIELREYTDNIDEAKEIVDTIDEEVKE